MSEYNQIIDNSVQDQNKVISLFQFIKELNQLKQKAIVNYAEYPWSRTISSLPDDPENISVFYRDRVEHQELADDSNILLSVRKPEFEKCPAPDSIFVEWLRPGWDSFNNEASYFEIFPSSQEMTAINNDSLPEFEEVEIFTDNLERVEIYEEWVAVRQEWVERQKRILQTRNLFADLYSLYFELQRDSETKELIVANGILCDEKNPEVKHPILTKRVRINYDPANNTVFLEEIDSQPELYSAIFQTVNDVNLQAMEQLQEDLQKNDYHPLDRNDTPVFLKVLVRQLSSDSCFSESGIPENWRKGNRLLLYMDPVYIMRKRLDGTLKAIEQIIENVSEIGYIPEPIKEIVSGGQVDLPGEDEEETLEEQLAAVGGESADVLLSKEANKEQLEIAKRIEKYNAVLVQGPPGTGKTHTIANLMGHFLAQGKSVLVTSHTPKALRVLKDKVAPGLQNLCVSVLEDSNADMERSIDGITDFMSRNSSHELKKDMGKIAQERRQIISDLAEVRRKIFRVIHQECNCIVYNGEEISPSQAAAFVLDHSEDLSYISGRIRLDSPLPMTFTELMELYRSNEAITAEDEMELSKEIPSPELLITPSDYSHTLDSIREIKQKLERLSNTAQWSFANNSDNHMITFQKDNRSFDLSYPEISAVLDLKSYAMSFERFESWMTSAAVDGKNGGAYRKLWDFLIEQILKTCDYAESLIEEQFGLDIQFVDDQKLEIYVNPLRKLKDIFERKGKLSKFTLMLNKDLLPVLENISINGQPIQSKNDCELILRMIELKNDRDICAKYWNELLSVHGVPGFYDLDRREPERIAKNWIFNIQKYLGWYENEYHSLLTKINAVGLSADILFEKNTLDSDTIATEKKLAAVSSVLPEICDICYYIWELERFNHILETNIMTLKKGRRAESDCCYQVIKSIQNEDPDAYSEAYSKLGQLYKKYELQQHRKEMLMRLEPIAPQWAEAIRNRDGIHGANIVPDTIELAWKWKLLSGIIEDLTKQPFCELQSKSIALSKRYREITAEYAEKSAWYHLLRRTEGDRDMQQALQGWKLTVKRIGKGTGRNAPALKAQARKLMSKCQDAVPSWIMPINRALESLNPKENRFDVIIIDEASQSDISSLAILYMGRKLIIVGDDKQVSPMAIGVETDKINVLQQMYIQGKIPNAHLYDGKTSIYDIAKTTFQPLMLCEHFRCVPEIIGFSNMLSYDDKIKPLREAGSSTLIPAVVNYRVADGKRLHNKTNPNEARAIVALMQACIEQPEYIGKTFGVISLLGDEQVRCIQRLIEEKIDHIELMKRSILCGNASNFQGDERDVIFLSMVDSVTADNPAPIRKIPDPDYSTQKRYNVAASRAKDQLWVVDSLDAATDLKPDDIRKMLIDYSLNPKAIEFRHAEIEKKADSPFEVGVAKALVDRGYKLVQQWNVGAYRLDMVVVCGKKTVAIECDGEKYHNGEAKIREDMERQTILERLGWRFIRIRGSEYFRDPDKTVERVTAELSLYGIAPEADDQTTIQMAESTELLERVKARAANIISSSKEGEPIDMETITAALNTTDAIKSVDVDTDDIKHQNSSCEGEIQSIQFSLFDVLSENEESGCSISNKQSVTESIDESIGVFHKDAVKTTAFSESPNSFDDIFALLNSYGIPYVDKRDVNGALWMIGGKELSDIAKRCQDFGVKFNFKVDGGRATHGKPGWWTK